MNRAVLAADIKREEGYRACAYRDHLGFLTIGHGFLVDDRKPGAGLTGEECDWILHHRLDRLEVDLLRAFPWFPEAPEPVQMALCGMAYQMGIAGLRKFRKTLLHIERGEYLLAADECLDSAWARQTPARARRVSEMFRQAAWDRGVRGGR